MRILLLPLAALCLGAAPAQPEPSPPPTGRVWVMPSLGAQPKACPDTPMSLARKSMERPQLRRLDELPEAEAFAAVDRRAGGCPAPMTLNEARSAR